MTSPAAAATASRRFRPTPLVGGLPPEAVLVSRYSFDVGGDDDVSGVSGSIVGTFTSTDSLVQGVSGASLFKSGGTSHVLLPASNATHALNALSLSFYYQPSANSNKHILFAGGDGSAVGDFSIERLTNGRLRGWHVGQDGGLRFFESTNGIAATNLLVDVAYRITLVLGPSGARLYLDGTLVASIAQNTNGWNNARQKFLGVWVDGAATPAQGVFDNLRLWSGELTLAGVAAQPPAQSISIPDSGLPEDAPLPSANNIVNVGNAAALTSALSSAAAGDHIVLANGNYGSFTISDGGTTNNPIVIRATNLLQATFSQLTISGNWVIVSGVNVDDTVHIDGSNIRLTRSLIQNGSSGVAWGPSSADTLVDHCDIKRFTERGFILDDPKTAVRMTVARCWIHEMLAGGSSPAIVTGFSFATENAYREVPMDVVARLNYLGPGKPSGQTTDDWIHHKGSKVLYAFNRIEQNAGELLSQRFGLRARWVGNYEPGAPLAMYDDLGWYYGNNFDQMRALAGRSGYYDETKNLANSVGGFHATTRCRIAGNTAALILGYDFGGVNWCSITTHPTLPDPIAAGAAKPQRSSGGVTYAAMPAGDGLSIRAHSGTISENSALTCIDQVQNLNSSPGAAAPAAWLTELLAEYPWIEGICPNPTSLTGGPSGTAPWSVAQALTRGDAGTPTTGPLRNSVGGL